MAEKYLIKGLEVTSAFKKVFQSGKVGFYGKARDPITGQRFQIIGAVEIADPLPMPEDTK